MASVQQMCSDVRLRVDDPLSQRPSSRRILQAVLDATQSFYNQLENTGQAWSLKPDYSLVVSNGTQDFLLAIDESYGKPIQVITTYASNPSFIPRYIEFREFAEMNFDWPYPQNIASWILNDGSNCTAMRMAFYNRDDGSRWVRVLPQPQLTATDLVTFMSGDFTANITMETSPVLSQFHSLIEIWASQSLLPSCQWSSDQNYNASHRKELAVALQNDRERFEDEFQRYCRNLVVDQMGQRTSSFDGEGGEIWGY